MGNGPGFCIRCRRERDLGDRLCPECGEKVVAQGFCEVCDRYLLRSVGDQCPKHDLTLVAAPAVDEKLIVGRDEAIDWVTIQSYGHPIAAEGPRIRLQSEGIPTFLEGERMGNNSLYQGATGGVKLQVPRTLEQDARILLAQSWSPPELEEDDLDDAWDDLGPEPGVRRRAWMKAAIILILASPLLVALFRMVLGR